MIVALTGYGRSGKNTVGDLLAEHHGFTQLAFADGVREAALAIDPVLWGTTRLSSVVRAYGWEGAKTSPYADEVRQMLQRIGTEAGWQLHGERLWVDRLFARIEQQEREHAFVGDYAITDLRFPHEAAAVQERGGYVVRIVRPGVGPLNGHESETLVDSIRPNVILYNDRSIDMLRYSVKTCVEQLRARQERAQLVARHGSAAL